MMDGRQYRVWERRLRRRSAVTMRRTAYVGGGLTLIMAGIALTPTPIPIGAVLVVIGLAVAARGSRTVGKGVKWMRRQVPPLSRGLNRLKPRLPRPFRRFVENSDPGI